MKDLGLLTLPTTFMPKKKPRRGAFLSLAMVYVAILHAPLAYGSSKSCFSTLFNRHIRAKYFSGSGVGDSATGTRTIPTGTILVSNPWFWHWNRSTRGRIVPIAPFAPCHQMLRMQATNSGSLSENPIPHRSEPPLVSPFHHYNVFIAVGSNLGDRFANIRQSLNVLCSESLAARVVRTSFLYETAPMYVTNQPPFLNGVVQITTNLEPLDLLQSIKDTEMQLGRNISSAVLRNGPRPVDLDILIYERIKPTNENDMMQMETPELTIPHPRIQERDFVMIPLVELIGKDRVLPGMTDTVGDTLARIQGDKQRQSGASEELPVRVIPLPRKRLLYFNEETTIIMGILNATPDSFSDGGQWTQSIQSTVDRALAMERQGARIIDVGGESTRPGAKEVAIDEELRRVLPIILGIRAKSDVILSIDTRHAVVAKAAIESGADMVNDVSGGLHDKTMLPTVGELGVPMILMHMRGTPETMQEMTAYDSVVSNVANALSSLSILAADECSIHRWQQMVDPGIGFAKDLRGNLLLLQNIAQIRSTVENLPLVIGTSRKSFIGSISGETDPHRRDAGTIASSVAALCLEGGTRSSDRYRQRLSILRVHNVVDCKQAVMVMDAIRNIS